MPVRSKQPVDERASGGSSPVVAFYHCSCGPRGPAAKKSNIGWTHGLLTAEERRMKGWQERYNNYLFIHLFSVDE